MTQPTDMILQTLAGPINCLISSTEILTYPFRRSQTGAGLTRAAPVNQAEHRLLPMTCAVRCRRVEPRPRLQRERERKESVLAKRCASANPNRKETSIETVQHLLNRTNSSAMAPSIYRQQLQNAAVVELVMDRGAERAAGGYDAL